MDPYLRFARRAFRGAFRYAPLRWMVKRREGPFLLGSVDSRRICAGDILRDSMAFVQDRIDYAEIDRKCND